jgi:HlyD family secretion protein
VKVLLDKKLAPQEEYDTAVAAAARSQNDLDVAQVRLQELKTQEQALELKRQDVVLAQAQVESDQISMNIATDRLHDTTVVSPMNAVVTARGVQIGQIIASAMTNVGGGTTIMTLSDLSQIFALASVDESDIGKVRLDNPATIAVDAYPDRKFRGKVVRIATRGVNTNNVVTYEVKIEVTSKDKELLKPEMTANVEVTTAAKEDVLLAPAEAVSRKKDKFLATVQKADGQTEERTVEAGISDGEKTEIVSGLTEGETLIVRKSDESKWRGQQPGGPGGARNLVRMVGGGGRGR